jgi:hypothetical protein
LLSLLTYSAAAAAAAAAVQVPWPDVAGALLQMDPKAFASPDDVTAVAGCLPSDDELPILRVSWGVHLEGGGGRCMGRGEGGDTRCISPTYHQTRGGRGGGMGSVLP